MMEAERGVKGVGGRLLYECDMTGRAGDGASLLDMSGFFLVQRSIADCFSARHTRIG